MASLASIVNVQIALNTAAVQRGTFGIPLIACPLAAFAERVRVYNNPDEAAEDNLPPELLTALTDAFSQIPRPSQIKVGRMDVASSAILPIEARPNTLYSISFGETVVQYTSTATPTLAEIVAGLVDAITLTAISGVTATVDAGAVRLSYAANVVPATKFTNLRWGTIAPSLAAGAVAADLSAINDEDSNWYGLVLVERNRQRQLDAAEWIEAREKLFVTASSEAAILDPSSTVDLISEMRSRQYFRTAIFYHTNAASEYPDAAVVARVFTIQPGAETWALKRLGSVSPSKLSATQSQTIKAKGGNTFEFFQPQIALTSPGKTAAGEWIDVIRFRDWLKDYMQTSLVQMIINRDKVPYTDGGIQLIKNNVYASLREGVRVGGIAPDEVDALTGKTVPGFVLTAPRASEVDAVQKASRTLKMSFVARLAGAIHAVEITGSLAYEIV